MPTLPATKITYRKLVLSLTLLLLSTCACGPAPAHPIVVLCSPDSIRMRQALDGLKANLKAGPLEVLCAPQFGPEIQAKLRQVQRLKPRLLIVLGTPALMQAAAVEKHTPMVFAVVANPYFTKVAYDPEHPEDHQENVTGLASPPPLKAALKEGAGLLGKAAWGLLYDPNDGVAAALAQEFIQAAPQFGLKPLTEASSAAATDRPGLERLLDRGARVLYLPPAAAAARYAPLLLDWGRRRKVMVVSSYPEGDHSGAILWVALDYHQIGKETATLAQRVLNGEAPKKIPLASSDPLKVEADETLLRHWSGYPGKN